MAHGRSRPEEWAGLEEALSAWVELQEQENGDSVHTERARKKDAAGRQVLELGLYVPSKAQQNKQGTSKSCILPAGGAPSTALTDMEAATPWGAVGVGVGEKRGGRKQKLFAT